MNRNAFLAALGFGACLLTSGLYGQSYSNSADFVLPEQFPLQNVYIGIQTQAGTDGAMLPQGLDAHLGSDGLVNPPGFGVPVGMSSFELASVMGSQGPNPHASQWAVFGLYEDAMGNKHVVLGTSADLTGVALCSQALLGSSMVCEESYIIEVLESGNLLGEGSGIAGAILNPLRDNNLMLNWGDRAQLFFFKSGKLISGGSVQATETPIAPEAPENLSVKQVYLSEDVQITWDDRSDNETGFRIQYLRYPALPSSSWSTLAEVAGDVTEYRADVTSVRETYGFRVAAFNEAGQSGWSDVATITIAYWLHSGMLYVVVGLLGVFLVGLVIAYPLYLERRRG